VTLREGRPARGARERVLAAALDLFADRGVSGTSLQMIADELGVTKAAVYHQFQTKEQIVLAVIEPAIETLRAAVAEAESRPTPQARRDAMLAGLVDQVASNRRLAAVIYADPAVGRLVRRQLAMRSLTERIDRMIIGPDPGPELKVTKAMIGGGLMVVGWDPDLEGMDDGTLRRHLLEVARRLLPPDPPSGHPPSGRAD
jgi:AcrR family transcriptional regulator